MNLVSIMKFSRIAGSQMMYVVLFFYHSLDMVMAKQSFIVSFQSDGSWSTDHWIRYDKDILNVTNDFTICHWEKTRYFAFLSMLFGLTATHFPNLMDT